MKMLLRSFLAWRCQRNRKEMASTARKGFAGLYFLSIDGLAEAGEKRGFLRCGRGIIVVRGGQDPFSVNFRISLGAETGPDGTTL